MLAKILFLFSCALYRGDSSGSKAFDYSLDEHATNNKKHSFKEMFWHCHTLSL